MWAKNSGFRLLEMFSFICSCQSLSSLTLELLQAFFCSMRTALVGDWTTCCPPHLHTPQNLKQTNISGVTESPYTHRTCLILQCFHVKTSFVLCSELFRVWKLYGFANDVWILMHVSKILINQINLSCPLIGCWDHWFISYMCIYGMGEQRCCLVTLCA